MVQQETLTFETRGRGTTNITREVEKVIQRAGIDTGICQLFIRHTSASLILCENADPTVRSDLERFMQRLVPDGDPLFDHTQEGADDMPSADTPNFASSFGMGRDFRSSLASILPSGLFAFDPIITILIFVN